MEYTDNNGMSKNEKLVDVYNMMKSGDLILKPFFQRNLVWNDNHKENFLETILKGYPFPEVYFADGELDKDTLHHKTLVVDGQQRLSTIYDYIHNPENLKLKRIKSFEQLDETEKHNFLYYTIVVRDLKAISKEDIREVFKRINSVSYALNATEIDNALYDGEFISTAQSIAELLSMSSYPFFSDSDEDRMKDVETVLIILSFLEIGAYFTGRKEVDGIIKQYDNEYPNKKKVIDNFGKVIKLIEQVDLRFDSIWYTKSGTFTLISELMNILKLGNKLPDVKKLNTTLSEIDKEVRKDEPSEEYGEFYYYFCQGTTSKQGRTKRAELLRRKLA
ncbi:MAG: DUF262 domain-containing protein [Lachnospiraceae bacterium]|nr:DUF262 domain-containing protein [Lachnospiraceae bacterium]